MQSDAFNFRHYYYLRATTSSTQFVILVVVVIGVDENVNNICILFFNVKTLLFKQDGIRNEAG